MTTITVNASRKYNINIGEGLLANCGELILKVKKPCIAAVVADDVTDALYGETVRKSLENSGFTVMSFVFQNGERSKNLETYSSLLGFLADSGLSRTDLAVALGGGVVGDLTGFAAATYLRGIDFVQIPTTLLAAVDSSVGGKTGIDLPQGKNQVGAFHQPLAVICDTSTLDTLPDNIFADGVSEAIKSGIIGDKGLFELLESGEARAKKGKIIEASVRVKAAIVEEDEKESGVRALLNLGHTFGHAVELLSEFSVSHGSAVAIGMVIAAEIAEKLGVTEEIVAGRIKNALEANGLPTECSYTAAQIANAAMSDKKRSGGTINLILPKKIGECVIYKVKTAELKYIIGER